tara:strand:- start:235 stop:531 length:297 start_codon:yes stop_codon:yes gene_type:complete
MNIEFQAINYVADQELIDFAQKRVEKLAHFFDHIISTQLFTKVEKNDNMMNKFVELKLVVPGDNMIIKKTAKSFEAAISVAVEAAKIVLKKHKEKIRD